MYYLISAAIIVKYIDKLRYEIQWFCFFLYGHVSLLNATNKF